MESVNSSIKLSLFISIQAKLSILAKESMSNWYSRIKISFIFFTGKHSFSHPSMVIVSGKFEHPNSKSNEISVGCPLRPPEPPLPPELPPPSKPPNPLPPPKSAKS